MTSCLRGTHYWHSASCGPFLPALPGETTSYRPPCQSPAPASQASPRARDPVSHLPEKQESDRSSLFFPPQKCLTCPAFALAALSLRSQTVHQMSIMPKDNFSKDQPIKPISFLKLVSLT